MRSEYDDHLLTVASFQVKDTLNNWQLQRLTEVLLHNHMSKADHNKQQDKEYIEMDGTLQIPRIVPDECLSHELEINSNPYQSGISVFHEAPPLKLIMGSLGILVNLHFVEDKDISQPLAADEVEVRMEAIGMNFKDCLIALGQISNARLGQERAGIVTRAGSSTTFAPGDRIILAAYEGYKTFARGKAYTAY